MDPYLTYSEDLGSCTNLSSTFQSFLYTLIRESEQQKQFSKPVKWIGIYITIASLFCILPMVADLLHGLKNKRIWFPCKYFTLNAASLTMIAIALKLPMDLSTSMPTDTDQAAKLGSMAFMCTMMANALPSIADMGNKELLANIVALGVLVITIVVDICIQIHTGLVSHPITIIYVAMLLLLLMIYVCTALVILKSKQILESKYQAGHETALKDLELQGPGKDTVEKLKQHVSSHWIMAGTGSPQFMTICSATTSASGVICSSSAALHVVHFYLVRNDMTYYGSDYKWSVVVILIAQLTGIILGTISPLFRCFASVSFKMSINWIWKHIRVFEVESCYTKKLSEWKHSSIPFQLDSRRCKCVIHDLKVLILSFCIGFQKMVVVACKMIALIPSIFVICVLCCFHCCKWLMVMLGASYNVSVNNFAQSQHKDLSQYVLHLRDDMELAERTLKSISKSVSCLIERAEKRQPGNLMKFLEESNSFEGVREYALHFQEERSVGCWSLPIVTLTTIAISLPNIQKGRVDRLLTSVGEGLQYVRLVEETLNATDDLTSIQKAAKVLWLEVEVYHKWLGNKLKNHQVNTTKEILQWFNNAAENIVTEVQSKNIEGSSDNMMVSANSMSRITKTILVSYHTNIDLVSQEDLFVRLSSLIAEILAACLTNLPQVIAMKCHTNVLEEREACVHKAAQLLGETMKIIKNLQDRQLPSINSDGMSFINKWRDCLLHPFP